jgi:subtilisin family serine protease
MLASFSNFGKNIDVVAPGVGVLSSVPIGAGQEVSVSTDATFNALELEFSGKTSGVTKTMVFCGIGKPEEFPAAVSGNIALIQRGVLTFADKVTNAMNAGAAAVIIYNNEPIGFNGTLGESRTRDGRDWVPALAVSGITGDRLKLQALAGAQSTVVNQISNWDHYSGTSMATPHAAGVIALIWSIDPAMPNTAVENILYTSCKDLGTAGYDIGFGHGMVDAAAAVAKLGR